MRGGQEGGLLSNRMRWMADTAPFFQHRFQPLSGHHGHFPLAASSDILCADPSEMEEILQIFPLLEGGIEGGREEESCS